MYMFLHECVNLLIGREKTGDYLKKLNIRENIGIRDYE